MDRDEVEVHKHAKKERGQYPVILTEQSWSIKDLLYDLKHQKMIFDLAGPSEKSRAGKMERYCPLGISRLVPQDQRSFFGVLSHIINPLLTKIVRSR